MDRIPRIITDAETKARITETNDRLNYSKKLEQFKALDIEMLVDLSSIEPEISEFADSDLKKGQICQMVMYPNGVVNLGIFNDRGSGKSYYQINNSNEFREGVHFRFK